ncbi:hypothetical protein Y600_6272 [Burkholderia pseudomallei MSHR3709]|nr:hypothetical protein Y600_6272 [Burkholderia pseudomallei MSHR3709]
MPLHYPHSSPDSSPNLASVTTLLRPTPLADLGVPSTGLKTELAVRKEDQLTGLESMISYELHLLIFSVTSTIIISYS